MKTLKLDLHGSAILRLLVPQVLRQEFVKSEVVVEQVEGPVAVKTLWERQPGAMEGQKGSRRPFRPADVARQLGQRPITMVV